MKHVRDLAGATALGSRPEYMFPKPQIIRADEHKTIRAYTKDGFTTYDQATLDSAGAFLISELERLDPTLHAPLVSTMWGRDINLRTDVQEGDTTSSYTVSTFGMGGTPAYGTGISYASSLSTTLGQPVLDIAHITNPLSIWANQISYSIPELVSSQRIGRPVDSQKTIALQTKWQMDIDQIVYIGDVTRGTTGLVNNTAVTPTNVALGASGSMAWTSKTYDEIMADVNAMLVAAWAATGYTQPPTKLLIAPVEYGLITTKLIGTAGSRSVLAYLRENNILTAEQGIPLEILSSKWLDKANINGPGQAAATYDRMAAYTQRDNFVRYPMVPLRALMQQYIGINVQVPYWAKLGVVELVYPETVAYRDGIG